MARNKPLQLKINPNTHTHTLRKIWRAANHFNPSFHLRESY